MTIKRIATKKPGYDCTRHPCGKGRCGKSEGGNHGIQCEEWIYAVVGADVAVELQVWSGIFPASIPADIVDRMVRGERYPWGVQMTTHARFPLEVEALKHITSSECHLLGACRYSDTTTVMYSEQFVRDAFVTVAGFEQPESFWLELEKYLAMQVDRVETERIDQKFKLCAECKGKGVVQR